MLVKMAMAASALREEIRVVEMRQTLRPRIPLIPPRADLPREFGTAAFFSKNRLVVACD